MSTPASPFDVQTLRQRTGYAQVLVLDEVDSTQRIAREKVDAHEAHLPALVVAHQQTAGRGRGRNRWLADGGSLAVTFMISPPVHEHAIQEMPLRAGLAVRRALQAWVSVDDLQIKWPNDVLLGGKKVAGLLCERRQGMDLIGLGLNVHLDLAALGSEVAMRATSMHQHLQSGAVCPGRQEVLIAIAREILTLWQDESWCETLNAIHALTGRDIVVHNDDGPLAGVCEGIDAQGRLLLRCGQTLHHLLDGTIEK
jgi:BirA family biotin operon repressor/biotin-[acetyl-CoA-carboxylase] ligase